MAGTAETRAEQGPKEEDTRFDGYKYSSMVHEARASHGFLNRRLQ